MKSAVIGIIRTTPRQTQRNFTTIDWLRLQTDITVTRDGQILLLVLRLVSSPHRIEPYPIGLFSHTRTVRDFRAVSVMEWTCATPILKMDFHILDRFCEGGKPDFHWNFVSTVHVFFWRFSPASLTESCLCTYQCKAGGKGGWGGWESGHGVGIWHFSKICSQIPYPRANHSSQMQPNFPTPGCTLPSHIPRLDPRKAQ